MPPKKKQESSAKESMKASTRNAVTDKTAKNDEEIEKTTKSKRKRLQKEDPSNSHDEDEKPVPVRKSKRTVKAKVSSEQSDSEAEEPVKKNKSAIKPKKKEESNQADSEVTNLNNKEAEKPMTKGKRAVKPKKKEESEQSDDEIPESHNKEKVEEPANKNKRAVTLKNKKKELEQSDDKVPEVEEPANKNKRVVRLIIKKIESEQSDDEVPESHNKEKVEEPANKNKRAVTLKNKKIELEQSDDKVPEVEEPANKNKRVVRLIIKKIELEQSDSEPEEPVKKPTKRGNKNEDDGEKSAKIKKQAAKTDGVVKNKTSTLYDEINFNDCSKQNCDGKDWNLKISNWNVDGISAWLKKGGLDYVQYEKPDILCLQETKCAMDKLPEEVQNVDGYKAYWHLSKKDGYAGVALFTKVEPISVKYGLDHDEHDNDGRMITAEYEKFFLISVYVPNAGRGLVTLPKRLEWNDVFRNYVNNLNKTKPVIICGDMNVAHSEIDLTNPKQNIKNAGFTKEERDVMTDFLGDGYLDTFRKLYPDKTHAYTFWSYMSDARSKNIGWRLDYFIVSERLMNSICDNVIRSEVFGSDHCPIVLFLHV